MTTNQNTVEQLKKILATSYALYLKTQNYHWNVTGPNFASLHALFEEHYTELTTAIDDIAERIRALGEKSPGSFAEFAALSTIKDGNQNASAKAMVKELHHDHTALIALLKESFAPAQQADDEVTIGLLTDRLTVHEKTVWMLEALSG